MDEIEAPVPSDDENISEKASQKKIKSAVSGNEPAQREIRSERDTPSSPVTTEYEEMESSVISHPTMQEEAPASEPSPPEYEVNYAQAREEQGQEEQAQAPQEEQAQEAQTQTNYEGYNAYQPISISPDTMSEVAEQVIAEKLSPIARSVDKLLDSRTSLEAQMKYIEDRLKRLEKIIDSLQLSLLQKVGEYVNNVSDIKTELVETQKTFKAMLGNKGK
jgi:hypothetical protein